MDLKGYYEALSTKRLIFRKLTYDDVESWMEFYDDNPNLQYLNIDTHRTKEVMAKAWIEAQIERYERNEFGQLAMVLKENNALIGTRGFKYFTLNGERQLESTGSFKKQYWRQGFGSESIKCIIRYLFKNQFAHQVFSLCDVRNTASRSYIKTVGYKEVSVQMINGRLTAIHKFTRDDWASLQEPTPFIKK